MFSNRTLAALLIVPLMLLSSNMIISGQYDGSSDAVDVPTRAGEGYFFDFGPRDGAVMDGWTAVQGNAAYDEGTGYGFLSPVDEFKVTNRFNEPSPYVLQRKWVYDEYANNLNADGVRSEEKVSFRVDMPNGSYRLVVWIGDMEKGTYSMNISVNDEWMVEGADAFHTVHRSMYFEYNPNPRDPRLTYLNYGMAVPYYLKVNVTEGYVIVNVTGNDTAYRDLLEQELARDPAHSYLSLMSTGTYKYSQGTGPWRFIGGPFTNASVLGLSAYPFPDFPIDGERESFLVDGDITDGDISEGTSAVNADDLPGGFEHWKISMDHELTGRNRLARAQLGMILAGCLDLDREIEILDHVEEDLDSLNDMQDDPAVIELRAQIKQANKGLAYEFERILYDQENPKNHFIEANKAFINLHYLQQDSPLYPKMRLWAARCLMNLDPHRWSSAAATALDMMEELRPLDPDNRYIKMYLDTTREDPPTWDPPTPVISTTGAYDNWTLNDYNEGFGNAPAWATILHEELGWLYDVTDWWVENRMQENGYLGGGWTDDVEMIGLFGFDALISEGADPLSLEGAGRFVEGMLESGQVNMTLGYSEAMADTEHTAELTGDSLPMMVAVDYGNPKWVEFSTKTAALMRDLWMDENEKGWYQFKSNYLSATNVGTGGRAEDSWINFRAALPALWAWWYSNDPEVQDQIVKWADCWVNAAMSTEKDKPEGIIPAGIGWPDGEIGGHNSPNWYTAAHPAGTVNYDWGPQKYKSYIVGLLESAFDATRNESFLLPLKMEADIARDYINDPDPGAAEGTRKWAGKVLGNKAISTYQSMLDKYQLEGSGPSSTLWRPSSAVESLEDGYHYIRKCYPLMTTEASATDRVLFVGVINPFQIYTGGSIGGALLTPQFTYSGLERDFAAMVRDGNARKANISLYGFYEEGRDVSVMPWSLEIGGKYVVRAGPDDDGNGLLDSVDQVVNFTYLSRGQKVPFHLPGEVEYILNIEQVTEGSGLRPLMCDPAFDEEDEVVVDKENGTVTVKVHNIGSKDAEEVDILLYEDLDGGLRLAGGARDVTIPAPTGLEPSIIEVDLTIWYEPWIGEVVIIIDPEDEVLEISGSNNEIRGYWDLEGIKITPPGTPVIMNGTIPVVEAYEDTPTGDVLDLSEYIWNPDGHGLVFSVAGISYSARWLPLMNGSQVSFSPSAFNGKDWSGTWFYNMHAKGPGADNIWETEDDPWIRFNITLRVLPVNDLPYLHAIEVDGVRYLKNESEYNFTVEMYQLFNATLMIEDIDGGNVSIGLGNAPEGMHLEGNVLNFYPEEPGLYKGIFIIVSDHDINTIDLTEIIFDVPATPPTPHLLGATLDPITLDMIIQDDVILMEVEERSETMIFFIFDGVEASWVKELDDPEDLIILNGTNGIVFGIEIGNTSNEYDISLSWTPDIDLGLEWYNFTLRVTIVHVNQPPAGLGLSIKGPHYMNEEIELVIAPAVDPDGDGLNYFVDWGGGGGAAPFGPSMVLTHTYPVKGNYTIIISAEDGNGGSIEATLLIEVIERSVGPDDDDEVVKDPEGEDDLILLILIGVIFLATLILMLYFFAASRKERYREDEVEEEEEMGAIEGAIYGMEEE